MGAVAVASCPHCATVVVGDRDAFCCAGCEMAWAIVHDAGLDAYYDKREMPGTRPDRLNGAWEWVQPSTRADGLLEATMMVDGLRCASCTWVVERLLERAGGVQQVSVSYASGRAWVLYDGTQTDLRSLASVVASVGYAPRPVDAAPSRDEWLARLGVAAFCTANLMLLTVGLYAGWADGMADRFQVLFRWMALALATPVALYAAAPFFKGAVGGLRVGVVGMDVPIALAVAVLYAHGVAQTIVGGDAYLDSLGMLVTLLLVGRVLEKRGRRRAADAAAAIAAALPVIARLRGVDLVTEVRVEELVIGDIVEVGAGDDVPADGVVVDGTATVQMAMLTGEATAVSVTAGGELVAGASVQSGAVGLRVERLGADTLAMRMSEAVRHAASKSVARDPADRLAPAFTLATIGVAVLAGVAWTATSGLTSGLEVAVAVLVVACPCALGLSVPLAVSSGLGAVARRGLVLRDGGQLLALADVKTIAMDKTGTVTAGQPAVLAASDRALSLAAGLERSSRHPIARALLAEQAKRGLPLPIPEWVEEEAGVGLCGRVDGRHVRVRSGGPGCVLVEVEGEADGLIHLGDRPRDDAKEAIRMLRAAGVRTVLLSGDHAISTIAIGDAVGVDESVGGLEPAHKSTEIERLRRGGPVAFVGDGLNDGPALASADVGLAMHTGVASSVMVADGVITQAALRPLVAGVAGARATQRAVRANLNRALVYNAVAVIAAAAGLINPLVAAILMPLSSALIIRGALTVESRLVAQEKAWKL